jgi:hypothetical protein
LSAQADWSGGAVGLTTSSNKDGPIEVGDIRALSTLSPVRPERLAHLRRRLYIVSWGPGFGRPLLQLATIHYGRWTVISSLPSPDGSGRPWWLNWSYLLFEASYDGAEDQYLDTFADIVPLRLSELFGDCFGFTENVMDAPRASYRVFSPAAFRRYVDRNKLEILHFGAAEPSATVNGVRQAIAMERVEARGFRRGGAALGRTQHQLEGMALAPPAHQPGIRDSVVDPLRRRVRGDYGVNPLTVIAPLAPGALPGLRQRDALAGLRGAHFARIALVDTSMQAHLGQPDPDWLETSYLVFTADHDGTRSDFVKTLCTSAGDDIFADCMRYPGSGDQWDFEHWLGLHTVRTRYYLAGYPPRTVPEIRRLVRARQQLNRWAMTRRTRRARH